MVFSRSGERHIDWGSESVSVSLNSTDVSLGFAPCSMDTVGDNIIGGPGFLGVLATDGI